MKHTSLLAIALGAVALLAFADAGQAGERRSRSVMVQDGGDHPRSSYYRKKGKTRVYGYVARRGGYSYDSSDVVNTYGQSRGLYGSTNSYRNPYIDRQTNSGPFDHGFFFDSGIGPRGGDSPYLN